MRNRLISGNTLLVTGIVLLLLVALYGNWLHPFFFGAEHAQVQGIDFFAVPKSFLNMLDGRSAFDTWGGPAYGPYATWYLAHPAFSVVIASWFSFFQPWTAYWLFVLFSILIMAWGATVLSKLTDDIQLQRTTYILLLLGFPSYWVYYTGNMHAPLVLALCLLFAGVFQLTYEQDGKRGRQMLLAGLLISLFSKPIVLLMLPLLLLLPETRKTTFFSLLIYGVVSVLFIIIPTLNPQSIGVHRILELLGNPDYVKEHLNIFKNNFVLNREMKDNSIHWLNLIAQSDYKLMHIDVFSLPVFMDTLLGKVTPAAVYKLPIYLCLLLSLIVPFIGDRRLRLESSLLLLMSISLTFFLSYNTVWEYQYSSALPLVALFPILRKKEVFYARYLKAFSWIGWCLFLPSAYFFFRHGDYNSASALSIIRLDRVLPCLLLFVGMIWILIRTVKRHFPAALIKDNWNNPGRLFFD